jgi:hypothetical protein
MLNPKITVNGKTLDELRNAKIEKAIEEANGRPLIVEGNIDMALQIATMSGGEVVVPEYGEAWDFLKKHTCPPEDSYFVGTYDKELNRLDFRVENILEYREKVEKEDES